MKKILTLVLLATLFAACGDSDDPEPPKPPYFNPIEGKWVLSPVDKLNNSIRVFTRDFHAYIYIYANGEFNRKEDRGTYTIDDKKVYLKGNTGEYKIEKDTLFLIFPQQTQKWIRTYETLPK